MDVCTIIAKNDLAYARVLGRSLREHEPDVRFKVLIIDASSLSRKVRAQKFLEQQHSDQIVAWYSAF